MPVRLWKPDAGKHYWEVMAKDGWHEVPVHIHGQPVNPGPDFHYAIPKGFQPWKTGDVIKIAVDFDEGRAWCRVSNGEDET